MSDYNRKRSRGSAELAALDGTQQEKAERFGVSQQAVAKWLDGRSTPSAERRVAIHAAGGPEPSAWDESEHVAPPAAAVVAPSEPATSESCRALAEELQALARAELRALKESDGSEGAGRRGARIRNLAQTIAALGKLTGAALLDEKQIVRSAAWARCRERLLEALTPYPDAIAACAEALQAAGDARVGASS